MRSLAAMAIVAGVACQCRAPSSPIPDGGYGLNPGDVLQFHKNPTRDGFYSDPAFTKAAIPNMHVDTGFDGTTAGQTFSQPLFMLDGAGGRATLFIATETDQVFALDAATGANLWTANLGTPAPKGEFCGGSIDPLGITGTPVIDPVSRTMFLDAMLNAGSNGRTPRQTVFALSVDDGSVRWKLDLSSAVSGFDSTIQNQRGALTLMDGIVYIPFGGLDGDCGPYRGLGDWSSGAEPRGSDWMVDRCSFRPGHLGAERRRVRRDVALRRNGEHEFAVPHSLVRRQ